MRRLERGALAAAVGCAPRVGAPQDKKTEKARVFCAACWLRLYAPACAVCGEKIGGDRVGNGDRTAATSACDWTRYRAATSAPGLGLPLPHICTGTGPSPPHICTGTGLAAATGSGPPHLEIR